MYSVDLKLYVVSRLKCLYYLHHVLHVVYAGVQCSYYGEIEMREHIRQASWEIICRVANDIFQVYPLHELLGQRYIFQLALFWQHVLQVPITARDERGIVPVFEIFVFFQPIVKFLKHLWKVGPIFYHILHDSGELCAKRIELRVVLWLDILVKDVLHLPTCRGHCRARKLDNFLRINLFILFASAFKVQYEQIVERLFDFFTSFVNRAGIFREKSFRHSIFSKKTVKKINQVRLGRLFRTYNIRVSPYLINVIETTCDAFTTSGLRLRYTV